MLISTACVVTKPIGEAEPIDFPRALLGAIVLGIVVSAVGAFVALCVARWIDRGEHKGACPTRLALIDYHEAKRCTERMHQLRGAIIDVGLAAKDLPPVLSRIVERAELGVLNGDGLRLSAEERERLRGRAQGLAAAMVRAESTLDEVQP